MPKPSNAGELFGEGWNDWGLAAADKEKDADKKTP
ncbi:hypothetical protein CLU90_5430 [Janthinobacterium sp. 67]|nr:hypothetical protein CLU90_5430 [Janthinobacterium sp. 67]